MAIFDWLFGRAKPAPVPPYVAEKLPPIRLDLIGQRPTHFMGITAPSPTDPAPQIRGYAPTPNIPTDKSNVPTGPADRRFILEPYFMMIEYTDATGTVSRRRITMRTVEQRGSLFYLNALCHERKALRTFRLDRIKCLISADGEVEDAKAWFDQILPTSEATRPAPKPAKTPIKPKPDLSPYTALRREITDSLTILIVAARSDDFLHPRELDRIIRFVEDEAFDLRDAGKLNGPVEAEEFAKIERTIRRLRPTQDDFSAALDGLPRLSQPRAIRLAQALADTIKADGHIDDIEASVLDEMRSLVARQHGAGWDA